MRRFCWFASDYVYWPPDCQPVGVVASMVPSRYSAGELIGLTGGDAVVQKWDGSVHMVSPSGMHMMKDEPLSDKIKHINNLLSGKTKED